MICPRRQRKQRHLNPENIYCKPYVLIAPVHVFIEGRESIMEENIISEDFGNALYYMLLVPATIPVVLFFLTLAWLGRRFFTNN